MTDGPAVPDLHNGAAEGDTHEPPLGLVVLAGPIRWWWQDDRFGGPEHREYDTYRATVHDLLVAAGYLVYAPHMAFKGRWHENAQAVNNAAISSAHCLVAIDVEGVTADGTGREVEHAETVGVPVVRTVLQPGVTVWSAVRIGAFLADVADAVAAGRPV